MKGVAKPIVCKTIFQVRYKPELKFYDIFRSAAQKLSGYANWTTDALNVTLRDFDNACSVNIRHNLFTFEQDSGDIENEIARINAALEILPSSLEIHSFNRLGYRRQYLVPVEMTFDSLVSVLNIKLLSQDDRLLAFLPHRCEDLAYRIDSADDLHRFHFHVGPLRKREIPQHIGLNVESHFAPEDRDEKVRSVLAGYPDTSLLIDIDVFQAADKLPLAEAGSFVVTARGKTESMCTMLSEYIFDDKVKG